jgi:hypothetical protein
VDIVGLAAVFVTGAGRLQKPASEMADGPNRGGAVSILVAEED